MRPKSTVSLKSPMAPSTADVAAVRAAHLMPLPGPMFAKPLQIVAGNMQFLFDESGKNTSTASPAWRPFRSATPTRISSPD